MWGWGELIMMRGKIAGYEVDELFIYLFFLLGMYFMIVWEDSEIFLEIIKKLN